MRRLVPVLLLLGAAAAEEVLHEARAWRGSVEVTSVMREPAGGSGGEVQKERVEFVVVTEPPKQTIGWPRLPFRHREGSGSYELSLEVREGEEDARTLRRGAGDGRLHPRVLGWVEPTTGRYRLVLSVNPVSLVAKTTISGMWEGKFTTWRTVTDRGAFLSAFDVEGELAEEGRVIAGTRTFLDRRAERPRDVEVAWRVERQDPVVRGRIVDHRGRPVEGLPVVASNTNPTRFRQGLPPNFREGTTDAQGRFRIEAYWAPWTVRVGGLERAGVVYEELRLGKDVELRLEETPDLDLEVRAYRLAALPRPELLRGHFQGDVAAYLAWLRARVPGEILDRALTE